MSKVAAWVYTAAATAATAYSAYEGAQASRDQRRANKLQERIQDVKAARERRSMLAKARVDQASILAQGQGQGGGQSSGVVSGAGQANTQAASGISFLNQVQDLTKQQSIFNQKAADHNRRAKRTAKNGG